jgi:hypothetical protein
MTCTVSECEIGRMAHADKLTVSSEQDTDDRVVLGDTQTEIFHDARQLCRCYILSIKVIEDIISAGCQLSHDVFEPSWRRSQTLSLQA